MRNKVAKRLRATARSITTRSGFKQNDNGVVMHAPDSYRSIYKGLKDSYKRGMRYG